MEESSIESFPYQMMMVHGDNHHLPISSYGSDGPTYVAAGGVGGGGGCGEVFVRNWQPFGVSDYTNTIPTSAQFRSSAGMAESSLGFPFTNAQWKELERQATVYKYMMASVPIPPHLLIPITRNLSDHQTPLGNGGFNFKLRFSSSNTDPEPGRCKRTDGKKWRCSRDVAPDQKYCERHMHRGRPRSRKPVEQQLHAINIKKTRRNLPVAATTAASDSQSHHQFHKGATFEPMSLGISESDSQWQNYPEMHLNLNSYTEKIPLTLSMGNTEMDGINPKSDYCGWLSSDSWVTYSTPGGPLAEVLRPAERVSGESSPMAVNGDSDSLMVASSPSGVLHKRIASMSDSSGNSSPSNNLAAVELN